VDLMVGSEYLDRFSRQVLSHQFVDLTRAQAALNPFWRSRIGPWVIRGAQFEDSSDAFFLVSVV